MTQEIATRPQAAVTRMGFGEMQSMAQMFVQSGMFQGVRDVAQAFVKIQAGQELGIAPFASMKGVHIIQGSIAIGATLVAGRMKAWGYDWEEIERTSTACVLRIIKPNGATAGTSSYTMDDAKLAQLTGKDNWKKYPKSMLFARAITDAARTWAPQVFAGIPVYTAEELGSGNTNADGEVIDVEVVHDRRGTRDDQKAVAERKIAEMQSKQIEAPMEVPAPAEVEAATAEVKADKPESQYSKMMKSIGLLKAEFESLNAVNSYYAVLKTAGYEHANGIKSIDAGRKVYQKLVAEIRAVRDMTPIPGQDDSRPQGTAA